MNINNRPIMKTLLGMTCAAAILLPGSTAVAQENAEGKAQLSFPGEYVRRVQNDEAVVVLGYRTANASVGRGS